MADTHAYSPPGDRSVRHAAIMCGLVAYEAIHFGEARERLRRRLLHGEAA